MGASPGERASPASTAATSTATGGPADPASRIRADETCTGKPAGTACWMEISHRPDCYVWVERLVPGTTATWTGECAAGLTQGTGTLAWILADGTVAEGPLVDGEPNGHWVTRFPNGTVAEGPYVDGEPNGHWVFRLADGGVEEGPVVNNERHGHWVFRERDGSIRTQGPYVNGDRQSQQWVRGGDGAGSPPPGGRPAPGGSSSNTEATDRPRGLREQVTVAPGQCTKQRLMRLGLLTSSIDSGATLEFTNSRMVMVRAAGGGTSLRQETEYRVTPSAITYRVVRAVGTAPGLGTRDVPVSNPGPHTLACSISGGLLTFGDGTWR